MKRLLMMTALLAVLFQLSQCKSKSAEEKNTAAKDSVEYIIDTAFAEAVSQHRFDSVSWLAIDPVSKNLFVLQRKFPAVSVWSQSGKLLSEWQTHELGYPHSITIRYEAGVPYAWVTDFSPPQTAGNGWGHCIKKFTISGSYLGSVGTCGQSSQGIGLNPVQFDKVTDVGFETDNSLFVSDGDMGGLNNRVLKMDALGHVKMEWSAAGNQPGAGPKEFNLPHAVVVDELKRVWVIDKLNSRLQVITAEGKYLGEWKFDSTMGPNGLSIGQTHLVNGRPMADVLIASSPINLNSGLLAEVWVIRALMDPAERSNFGERKAIAYWKEPNHEGSAMLHSAAISSSGSSVYLGFLNEHTPPIKYIRK
jgi:hypothetical protein